MTAKHGGTLTLDNGGAVRSRRWGRGKSDPVARFLSPRLGLSPKSCEHLLTKGPQAVNLRAAEIVAAFHALGDTVRLERFMDPIRRAYEERTPPPLCAATYRLESEADGREDVDVEAFQLEPSEQNRDRALRALDQVVLRTTALRDAIAAAPLPTGPRRVV